MNKKLFASILVFAFSVFIFAENEIPDSSSIRASLIETWFEAPLALVRLNETEVKKNEAGEEFQISLEETENTFTIVVAPRAMLAMNVYEKDGKQTRLETVYPKEAQGSWILSRNKNDGSAIYIRYYFSSDTNVYVQFEPSKTTSEGNFILYNFYAVRGNPTGVPFSYFYKASFNEVKKLMNKFPWEYADHDSQLYENEKNMIQTIRSRLSDLVYADDAMYDEFGKPVSILTGKEREVAKEDADKLSLSSAGFVKWIADGIVNPMTNGALKREPLLQKTVSYNEVGYQGILQQTYSTSFALDWTRNIATALFSIESEKMIRYENAGIDMKEEPFASVLTENGMQKNAGYIKDTGYKAADLVPLLYVLASRYPGEFYFAAIRQIDRKAKPEIKFFSECAVIFPYFDATGSFQCAVFRNGKEYTLSKFVANFRDDFVHLTRARSVNQFTPQ